VIVVMVGRVVRVGRCWVAVVVFRELVVGFRRGLVARRLGLRRGFASGRHRFGTTHSWLLT
jgi:hypothetical protein